MLSVTELVYVLQHLRIDAVLSVSLAGVGCAAARRWASRRGAEADFSREVCLTVVAVALAGALLAEWTGLILGYPASATLMAVALARIAVIAASIVFGFVLLVTSLRLAVLRSEIRAHADTARQLQEAKTAADQANRAKSDFLAVVSHEIRTPLNAVMGFASLLAETRLDDTQRGYLATITTEGSRLGSLINDILDLTKIEEGRLVLERLPFAPVESASEVLRLLSVRAAEKNIDLRFEAQVNGPLLVAGDPLRFRQILVNLVDNAIKFTPRGSVTLFLHWTPPAGAAAPQGQLQVRVVDTGIGIASEKLQDLFQKFMQVDTSTTRRYGGTGLGLAICRRLVRLMGGEIEVRSTLGEGSEFAFTLPLSDVALPAALDTPAPEATSSRSPLRRVLVVDDMETNRFLLEVFLRRNGFEPTLAAGGLEAIRLAATNTYDVILMDLQMPDLDGYTAAQKIRAAEFPGRHTPIIALTASIAKDTRTKCLAAGMNDHLTKPLDLRKFKPLLEGYISAAATKSGRTGS